jgi:hypothetical protein
MDEDSVNPKHMKKAESPCWMEEEKKESTPQKQQEEQQQQQCSLEKQREGLPEELDKNKTYGHESELRADLERFELTDLHVVLNTEGNAVWREMPSSEHRRAVDVIKNNCTRGNKTGIWKSATNPLSSWIRATLNLPI